MMPPVDETRTIAPPLAEAEIATARASRNAPTTLTSRTSRNSAGASSRIGAMRRTAAQCTRWPAGPKALLAAARARRQDRALVAQLGSGRETLGALALECCGELLGRAPVEQQERHAARASARAVAAPRPPAAPLTTTGAAGKGVMPRLPQTASAIDPSSRRGHRLDVDRGEGIAEPRLVELDPEPRGLGRKQVAALAHDASTERVGMVTLVHLEYSCVTTFGIAMSRCTEAAVSTGPRKLCGHHGRVERLGDRRDLLAVREPAGEPDDRAGRTGVPRASSSSRNSQIVCSRSPFASGAVDPRGDLGLRLDAVDLDRILDEQRPELRRAPRSAGAPAAA